MKKIINSLLLLSFIAVGAAKAQPYGHVRYNQPGAWLSSGRLTSINSSGHLMAGYKPLTTAANHSIWVAKTGPQGNFASGTFPVRRAYQMWHSGTCTGGTAAQILNCEGVDVLETNVAGPTPGWYALAGTYDKGVFFSLLDQFGNPIATTTKLYMFPAPYSGGGKPYIYESPTNPNNYYICGTYQTEMYVIKVNASGTILWSSYYNCGPSTIITPQGLIECPSTGDITIVGYCTIDPIYNRGAEGFFMKLDAASGNVNVFNTYGTPTSGCQRFYDIKLAGSNYGGKGFVISGWTDSYPAEPWFVKLDWFGGLIWTTVVEPSSGPAVSSVPGIIARMNTSSKFEYYGAAYSTTAGMVIMKLDETGTPFTTGNNEFVYDAWMPNKSGPTDLDFMNTGSNIALTVYGTDDGGAIPLSGSGGNFYMVRSYFNGASGCHESLGNVANYYFGPSDIISPPYFKSGSFTACSNFQLRQYPYVTNPVAFCSASSLPGGSNAKMAGSSINDEDLELSDLSAFPNPANNEVTLTYWVDQPGKVKIELYDNTGRLITRIEEREASYGEFQKKIDFSQMGIESGVYLVSLVTETKTSNLKVIYNK